MKSSSFQPKGLNKLNRLLKIFTMAGKTKLPDIQFKHLTNTTVRTLLCHKLLDNKMTMSLDTRIRSLCTIKGHFPTEKKLFDKDSFYHSPRQGEDS